MNEELTAHYSSGGDLVEKIAASLQSAGKDLSALKTTDLAPVDEFHIRGRRATLELAAQMKLFEGSQVLDIGSGLGGPARTLAEAYGCHVMGLDLTQAYCDVARVMSEWVNLGERTEFHQGDATNLPFVDNQFDAAMTIHVAMNIAAKDKVYEQARRVVKPGAIFAVYDVLQGTGGDVLFPVPWAREPSISHLATPEEMTVLLTGAGFNILDAHDSTDESQTWFEEIMERKAKSGAPSISSQVLFGGDAAEMIGNQIRNLADRRIRTVSYICEA
jgi:ubiquinone/menaquinone biosynthesis C-methylase UbiE